MFLDHGCSYTAAPTLLGSLLRPYESCRSEALFVPALPFWGFVFVNIAHVQHVTVHYLYSISWQWCTFALSLRRNNTLLVAPGQ